MLVILSAPVVAKFPKTTGVAVLAKFEVPPTVRLPVEP